MCQMESCREQAQNCDLNCGRKIVVLDCRDNGFDMGSFVNRVDPGDRPAEGDAVFFELGFDVRSQRI